MKFAFVSDTAPAVGEAPAFPAFPTAESPPAFPTQEPMGGFMSAPVEMPVVPTPGVAEWLWNPKSVQDRKAAVDAAVAVATSQTQEAAFPVFPSAAEPAAPQVPVQEEAVNVVAARTQKPQDQWAPRPGVLVDFMTLLVRQRREEQERRQAYAELINKLKVQYPELAAAEAAVSEAARQADGTHFEVDALARKYKQGAQVPGCKVSFSNPKTKVCEYADLVAAWPAVDDVCPEVIKKLVDVKALQTAAAAGRTPEGLLEKVVTEKAMTSEGRLKIEVTL